MFVCLVFQAHTENFQADESQLPGKHRKCCDSLKYSRRKDNTSHRPRRRQGSPTNLRIALLLGFVLQERASHQESLPLLLLRGLARLVWQCEITVTQNRHSSDTSDLWPASVPSEIKSNELDKKCQWCLYHSSRCMSPSRGRTWCVSFLKLRHQTTVRTVISPY